MKITGSWKTDVAGAIATFGIICGIVSDDPAFSDYASTLTKLSLAIGLFFARDNRVSDQQVGIRPEPTVKPIDFSDPT